MPTYAAITAVPADRVLTALGQSKLGGYLYPGTAAAPGCAVLFDPPKARFGRISHGRRLDPAWRLAVELKAPVWLIESGEAGACATACYPTGGYDQFEWADDWTPPSDPAEFAAHLAAWRKHCLKTAEKMLLADPDEFAALRNDPTPDGTRTSAEDLLRHLCTIVGAPTTAVGQSLLTQAGPAGREFTRFEAKGR
ncbi:hypothetical protein CFP65_1784 [Kitasatospora sp. MMS16-BH015]|uniref:hypothetical protein n=1 Tax=Kitasatospora sp. MMS16-BH015 TaxID=2018025 RepID=UPI000CA3286F|nr:hypothetical protein [Kitasatospora sp. MMS16-BH015]AUG76661.1 hypothetical protein CFP65_1784 [Kitasatospora sp. MMS16-BH015]